MADYSISAEITADSSKFNKGVNNAEKSLKSFSKGLADNINKLGKNGLVGAMANVSLAVGGLTKSFSTIIKFAKDVGKAINECTEAYKTQVIAERALDTAIQNNPFMTGASSQTLKQFASDIQSVTNYGDEQLLPLIANLTSLGRTQEEVMQIVSVATDMASTGTMSLDTAIQQLNMTLNGNLGRLGMQNAELKDLTEEELKSGKAVEILGEKFKGLASATVDTSKQLQNIKGDFKEAIGEFTLPSSDMWNKFWAGFYEKGINVIKSFNEYLDREVIGKKVMQSMTANAGVVASAQGLSTQDVLSDLRYLKEQLKNLNDEELRAFQNYLANSKTRTQSEERMLTISKQILESRGLQSIQEQKEAEAKKAQLQDEQSIVDLKEKYLKLIAEQEAKWENIKSVTGKTVSNEEKLKFYQEQLVAIMTESGGQITENNQYYKDQMEIINRIKKLLGEVAEETDDIGNGLEVTQTEFKKFFAEIKKKAEDWSSTIKDIAGTMYNVYADVFTQLGKDLVEGSIGWENYASIAVKGIADVLRSLSAQLSALAVTKIVMGDYAKGITAMAGATSAMIASGVAQSLVKTRERIDAVGNSANKAGKDLEYFIKRLQEIQSGMSYSSRNLINDISKLGQVYREAQKARQEAYEAYATELGREGQWRTRLSPFARMERYRANQEEIDRLQEEYDAMRAKEWEAFKAVTEASQEVLSSIKSEVAENKQLVSSYKEIYKSSKQLNKLYAERDKLTERELKTEQAVYSLKMALGGDLSDNLIYQIKQYQNYVDILLNEQKLNIQTLLTDVYDQLSSTGKNIGDTLTKSLIKGATKNDFLLEMKSYIRENLIKLTVYTSTFQDKLAVVGRSLSEALVHRNTQDTKHVRDNLEKLWEEASQTAKIAESIIDRTFGDIQEEVKETTDTIEENIEVVEKQLTRLETAMEAFKDSISDVGGDIASNLIEGLSNGLNQSDFLSSMKQWIKKVLVQSVVYTESMKAEIEAIGKAITKGITEGFTDTSFDEIRRDLSFIFDQANRTVAGIDNVLNSVFGGGYAIGTDNATRGLHLVGEAGPELVRFRGGEQVLNAGRTQKVLAGGNSNTFNVNFTNVKDTSAYALVSQLKQYNRTMAINGVL